MRIVLVSLLAVAAAGCGPATGAEGEDDGRRRLLPARVRRRADRRAEGRRDEPDARRAPSRTTSSSRPGDVARIQTADVVLYLSHGFQPAVEQALDGAQGQADRRARGPRRSTRSRARPTRTSGSTRCSSRGSSGGSAPRSADRERANELAARVLALDRDYRTGLAHCARRDFVTSHAAFGYLAARYHLHQIAITGIDPESEPSPKRLAALIDLVRREHVTTVFFERLVSPRLAETVARDAGAKTAVLDPIEGLTPSEQSRGDDYLTLMRENLRALRGALGCR